jgi:hypothetical protein
VSGAATATRADARAAALAHVTGVLDALSTAQLHDLAAGRLRLVFRPDPTTRSRRPEPGSAGGTDVAAAAVAEIGRLTSPSEVAGYLTGQRFTVPVLREIARALGPTVSSTGRSKDDLIRDIVEGTAGFRIRSAAMSGGAWS